MGPPGEPGRPVAMAIGMLLLSVWFLVSCGLLPKTQPPLPITQKDQTSSVLSEGKEEIKLAFPVYFDLGQNDLPPQELLILDKIAEMMKKFPHVHATVTGYRNDQEDGLSRQQVQYVADYLISRGIATTRLKAAESPRQNGERGRIDIMALFSPTEEILSPPSGKEAPAQEPELASTPFEYLSFTEKAGYPEYKIGLGDVLEITLKTRVTEEEKYLPTVRPDGTISIPFIEPIQVQGLTPREVEETLSQKLSPLYRRLWVNVLVKEYQSHRITILGAVGQNGSFPLRGKTSLLDVVAVAGAGTRADLTRVTIRRRDGSLPVVNLTPGRAAADAEFIADAGDVIFVPVVPEMLERVMVLGDVRAPGVYPLSPGMTPLEAIARAGGYTDIARPQATTVIRGDPSHPEFIPVDVTKVLQGGTLPEQLYLRNEDIVYVPRGAVGNVYTKLKPILELIRGPTDILTQILIIRRF